MAFMPLVADIKSRRGQPIEDVDRERKVIDGAAANAREPNSRIGIIGASLRRSKRTKASANTTPSASAPITSALAQPN